LSAHGGVLPLNTKLVRSIPRAGSEGEQWYLVGRNPVISGREMRNARAGQDEFRKWETNFTLSQDGGRRFGTFTGANIGNRLAVVLDNNIVSVATIQAKINDSGRITGLGSEEEAVDRARCRRASSTSKNVRSAPRWAPIRSTRASWPVSLASSPWSWSCSCITGEVG
jgi:preprotein translocase subunit SecD